MQANDHFPKLLVQANKYGSEEDDLPQPAAHAPDGRGWSQEDVATLKRGVQVHGHQWAKIQWCFLLGFVTARSMAGGGVGLLLSLLLASSWRGAWPPMSPDQDLSKPKDGLAQHCSSQPSLSVYFWAGAWPEAWVQLQLGLTLQSTPDSSRLVGGFVDFWQGVQRR